MGIIREIGLDVISELINDAQPATIMMTSKEDMDPGQRDAVRARLVREKLHV